MRVIIVGASSAGLYLAYLLAREGVEVEVLEKISWIGWPLRTLIVTSKLSEVLGFEPEEAILNRVKYLNLHSGERSVQIELGTPDLVVERQKLLLVLAEMAIEAGAKILLGHEVLGLKQDTVRGKIRVKMRILTTEEIREDEADFLVGADGIQGRIKDYSFCKGNILYEINPKGRLDELEKERLNNNQLQRRETQSEKGCFAYETKAVLQLKINLENKIGKDGQEKVDDREEKWIEKKILLGKSEAEAKRVGEKVVYQNRSLELEEKIAPLEGEQPRKRFDPQICEVWFDPARTKYFFWVIPESAVVAAVGLISDQMAQAEQALKAFLRQRGIRTAILEEQAALVPLPRFNFGLKKRDFISSIGKVAGNRGYGYGSGINGPRMKKLRLTEGERGLEYVIEPRDENKSYDPALVDKANIKYAEGKVNEIRRICLVGDAAGQVKATTVGGVVAGLRAAKAIAGIILGREEGKRDFQELKRELELHLLLRKVLNRFQACDYDRLLQLLEKNAELRELVGRRNRDEAVRFLPPLLLSHPSTFFLGVRAVLRSLF